MAAKARIFFAGVGTTFAILAIGFGGGLLMANSMHETAVPKVLASKPAPAVRTVLPPTSEPAFQVTAAVPPTEPAPPAPHPVVQAVQAAQHAGTEKVEREKAQRAEQRKAEVAERERRKRYAERKAKREVAQREAARRKHEQERQQVVASQRQPGILAFGTDDEQSRSSFFGN